MLPQLLVAMAVFCTQSQDAFLNVASVNGGIVTLHSPPSQPGTLHTVFAVLVQAVLRPAAPHVLPALQRSHGVFPDADQVVPAVHATLQTVFAVLVQGVLTPAAPHVLQPVHTALPDVDQVEPATHGTLHTVFAVLVQGVLTPAASHVLQPEHGVLPDADQVEPAAQAAGGGGATHHFRPQFPIV